MPRLGGMEELDVEPAVTVRRLSGSLPPSLGVFVGPVEGNGIRGRRRGCRCRNGRLRFGVFPALSVMGKELENCRFGREPRGSSRPTPLAMQESFAQRGARTRDPEIALPNELSLFAFVSE